jgi:hypothetical protein
MDAGTRPCQVSCVRSPGKGRFQLGTMIYPISPLVKRLATIHYASIAKRPRQGPISPVYPGGSGRSALTPDPSPCGRGENAHALATVAGPRIGHNLRSIHALSTIKCNFPRPRHCGRAAGAHVSSSGAGPVAPALTPPRGPCGEPLPGQSGIIRGRPSPAG